MLGGPRCDSHLVLEVHGAQHIALRHQWRVIQLQVRITQRCCDFYMSSGPHCDSHLVIQVHGAQHVALRPVF